MQHLAGSPVVLGDGIKLGLDAGIRTDKGENNQKNDNGDKEENDGNPDSVDLPGSMRRGERPSLTTETAARGNPVNQNGQTEKEANAVEALEVHPEGKQNKGNVTGPEQAGFFSILIFQSILLSSAEEPQKGAQRKRQNPGHGRGRSFSAIPLPR